MGYLSFIERHAYTYKGNSSGDYIYDPTSSPLNSHKVDWPGDLIILISLKWSMQEKIEYFKEN